MLRVVRAPGQLVLYECPSLLYRMSTLGLPLCALLVTLALHDSELLVPIGRWLAEPWAPRSALFSCLLLGLLLAVFALLRAWKTTTHHFERSSGTLSIRRGGPLRTENRRNLSFSMVSGVIDRRSARERALELVLADHSTLVLARTASQSAALDGIADDVGALLRKPVHFSEGTLLGGRFEIEQLVEQGGMGAVYRALDRASGERVALKLALVAAEHDQQEQRFEREIRLLEGIDHPRIVRHLSHGSAADGRAYLAMQWLAGEDLRAVLLRGPLTLADSLQVLRAAAEALAAVHGQRIVHRDLKPANLFLCAGRASELMLLDFGIARHFENATRLTGSRAIVGTPHYMAPEQASSARDILPAADIFSLGCIFYECLTGARPFEAQQLAGVLARILFDSAEPVSSWRADVPEPWLALLTRMLAKDPGARPADGAELLRELSALPPAPATTAAAFAATVRARAEAVSDSETSDPALRDRVLVSVVLARLVHPERELAEPVERLRTIQSALQRFHCPIERLVDGSLLATVLPQHSAADQARIAANCALYLRELLPEASIAVATGRATPRHSLRVGDAVDRAVTLLEPSTSSGEIRLDTVTAGLVAGRFETALRDGNILLANERQDLDESRPLLGRPTPCVGRELELLQLEGLMSSAFEESLAKAAVVIGPPGIGKSRLRHELSRRLRERHPEGIALLGYGDPLSAGSPYVLAGDALRRHAGIRAGDPVAARRAAITGRLCQHVDAAQRQRVSEFLGELCGVTFPAEASPPLQAARGDHRVMSEQITMAFLDWLSAECKAQPTTFVLEDVQWGDALTLKLLEAALRSLEQAPLAVLVLGRPEAEEAFPKLLLGQRSLSLSLGVLSKKASELLIRGVLGPALSDASLQRIVGLAAGNALFLEELIRAAAEGKAGDVPETVLAMLQARLSRLSPEARLTLRAASVFGERFWLAGVARVSAIWGLPGEPSDALARLAELELIEQSRTSRFPGELEYCFRHALVCDAAYGLLTESDRRSGHGAAGEWLEAKAETDAIVLARHADEGGNRERALSCYRRAAEQSLAQYDFGEALVRASKGVSCGASGETLGVLESIQAAALYSLGQWMDAAQVGGRALALLPRGSMWWCATVEKLMQVLPNVNQLQRSNQLSDELLEIVPTAEARAAYIRALHTQLLGYAVSGAHERGRRSLAFIDRLGTAVSEPDVATRGYARLWRSVLGYILGDDLSLALSWSEQAIVDLSESQVLYRLSLAHIIQAFIWWGFGDLDRSEQAARKARAIAEQIHDDYHAALAAWYLAVTLAERPEPEKLEEAAACAWVMVLHGDNPLFEAVARCVSARVALARGDWVLAESEGRRSMAGLVHMPPYGMMSAAYLLQALTEQRRWEEACSVARQSLDALRKLGGPLCSEVLVLVAAAEALFGAGHMVEAEAALVRALQQIELRAAKIRDPQLRATYLTQRYENRHAAELAARLSVRAGPPSS